MSPHCRPLTPLARVDAPSKVLWPRAGLPSAGFNAAEINWGDGTSHRLSPAQFTTLSGGGSVALTHIYGDDGPLGGRALQSLTLFKPDDSSQIIWTQTLQVTNVAPTATLVNSGPAAVGGVATVTLSNFVDPSSSDLASLRLSYDFNNDGDFNDVGDRFLVPYSVVIGTEAISAAIPNSVLAQAGSRTIHVRVHDDDGGHVDLLTTISVAPDATAPTSSVADLPDESPALEIPIYVTGSDPLVGGVASGVLEYEIYVSVDAGAFELFATVPAVLPATIYRATSNHTYFFRSVARDRAGNLESEPAAPDTQTHVGDLDPPATSVQSTVANSSGLFQVVMSGSEIGGGQLRYFDLYVAIDGGTAELISSTPAGVPNASGFHSVTTTYQGRTDGNQHSYRFFSVGRDSFGNVEPAPNRISDVAVSATFAAVGLQATGIDVQLSADQRSYIRTVDVLFNSEVGLAQLLLNSPLTVERFDLNASNANTATPGSGTPVTGFSTTKVGDRLRLDWGAGGITGSRTAFNQDYFYRVWVDGNGDGDYADAVDKVFEFARILGDANGDEQVDQADLDLVNAQINRLGPNLNGDIDGSYTLNPNVPSVNSLDVGLTNYQKGQNRRLSEFLKSLLDD